MKVLRRKTQMIMWNMIFFKNKRMYTSICLQNWTTELMHLEWKYLWMQPYYSSFGFSQIWMSKLLPNSFEKNVSTPDLSWKILCCEEITPRTLQHLTTKLFLLQSFKLSVWSQYLSENIGLRNCSLYYRPRFCLQSTLAAMLFSLRRNKRCLIFLSSLILLGHPNKMFHFPSYDRPIFSKQ